MFIPEPPSYGAERVVTDDVLGRVERLAPRPTGRATERTRTGTVGTPSAP
ncbi:hypothetical protein [Kineosporia sp. A_224]|nr:hypothetical protein [Kineosporia sp. A_224]